MNVDQQQQQQHHQQQQQQTQSMLATNEIYANYNPNNEATQSTLQPVATTYVTIGMLPPPPPPTSSEIATISAAGTPGSTTSTFKTPLLPMPTLDDIEGTLASSSTQQPIPGGILKYPTNTISMNLPIGMSTGPTPPPPLALAPTTQILTPATTLTNAQPPPATLTIDDATTCGTLKSNAKLLHTTAAPMLPPTVGILTNASTTASNITAHSKMIASCTASTASNLNSSSNNLQHKPASKCCCCFGSGRADTKAKKRKHKRQTLWSAFLTNLGICALLLAYTLLGSFIFLTIESEDSALLHHQRTLASTKRAGVSGRNIIGGSNNIYYTQLQQQQQQQQQHKQEHQHQHQHQQQQLQSQRLDNDTVNGITSTFSASSSATSSSSGSSVLSISPSAFDNNGNDFIYGDDGAPESALSADTYDVRQRTIENIWDITVSLNILYKENWTKLAALEISKFQDQLIKRLNEDALVQLTHDTDGRPGGNSPATEAVLLHHYGHYRPHEWNFAKAFLYSLTVLTTIGYGNIAPKTTLGRMVTLAYAIFGIPLTLVYLSSTGGIMAKVAREVFSKALCCCLCSNCGYCCYDEKRMAEKERRTKRKRQQEELRKQHAAMKEPYYVRSSSMHDNFQTPEKQPNTPIGPPDIDSLSASESRGSMHGLSILAPILLCFSMMIIYIMFGALVLYRLENWPLLDGVYFCFMSLSTIGFGDMLPGLRRESNTTTWFCSIYIMSGMALTAMCFNVIHEEIVNRIKIVVEFKKSSTMDTTNDEQNYYMPP